MMALPVDTSSNTTPTSSGNGPTVPSDGNSIRKFYTITASLRETYDDNVNTTKDDKVSALETSFTPSVLVDFPSVNSDFSARETFGVTYYSAGGSGVAGDDKPSINLTDEFVAQYQKSFSDRYTLNASEQFRYYSEPSIYESTGTLYSNGSYISNIFNPVFTAQWTPLFSTTTTYSNTVIRYQDALQALQQNSIENTESQSFNYAVFPKITLSVGAIADDISYEQNDRGYNSYTLYAGAQWEPLPSLTLVGRVGGSYTLADQAPASVTPYIDAEIDWTLGQKSSLNFIYTHEVVPTDQFGADGEVVDRFSGAFNYNLTSRISTNLQLIYSYADVTQTLLIGGLLPAYTENDYGASVGATYHYDNYVDFEGGFSTYGISSGLSERDYNRNQVYLGVRGTY